MVRDVRTGNRRGACQIAGCIAVWLALALGQVGLTVTPAYAQDASGTQAQDPAAIERLALALHLAELLGVMRDEGVAYGQTIADDLFVGAPSADWDAAVRDIYAIEDLTAAVAAAFAEALDGRDIDAMLAFLSDGPGATAAALEVSTRAARLDPDVEQAADEAAALAIATRDPRIEQINRYIAANDLIERNVADAMTSNYAFYLGLKDGGALPASLTEDDILRDVWSQSTLIRQNLTEWHYSFLYMAFQPLGTEDIEAYIAFSQSPAGRDLNAALFQTFDVIFTDISYALGRAAAESMVTQDL